MKIAAQTVIWGNRFENLTESLDVLARNGFDGVEFSQRPEHLGPAKELRRLLLDRGLQLVGLSGGTVEERIAYCGDYLDPLFIYVERWDDSDADQALSRGFELALHPHVFKHISRLSDVDNELELHPELKFLPDVAHLTIVGDSPALALDRWSERIVGVHLGDWTPVYGRSSHRYTRGFVDLGKGIVNFDQIFSRLHSIRYDGWLIFEQGNPDTPAAEAIQHAAIWLARKTRRPLVKRKIAKPETWVQPKAPIVHCPYSTTEKNNFFESILSVASEGPRTCYHRLAEAVGRLLKSPLVILCSCSQDSNLMAVIGVFPETKNIKEHFRQYEGSLSSVALERQSATIFDLTSDFPGLPYGKPLARFGYPVLRDNMSLLELISVPVLDPRNPRQARFVLNIFSAERSFPFDEDDLAKVGQFIARAAESALDERCAIAAAGASLAAGRCLQAQAFLESLRDLLLESLDCEALTVFLVDDSGNQLEEAVSTGLTWSVPRNERFYKKGEGLPGRAWMRGPIISTSPTQEKDASGKSDESKAKLRPSLLCAPMLDAGGGVVGVIRCQNKSGNSEALHMFSGDDLAVLDAVCQAAVPHLQVLLSKERRGKALRRLTHELNNPLIAIGGATRKMRHELERRRGTSEAYFSEDYIGDIESWLGLMTGLLGNADVFRFGSPRLKLYRQRVLLYADVFMPAVQQIFPLLLDRDFSASRISIRKFQLPALWLDKNRINQVIFNFLTNAIKYAHNQPSLFRVLVKDCEKPAHYEISFSDWGIGIRPEMKEAIFLEGVRSKDAEQSNVAGDGLGLWVAKRIVEAHGGYIQVTHLKNPTTFSIYLPKTLSARKAEESDLP